MAVIQVIKIGDIRYFEYQIESGDTLIKICERFGHTNWSEIYKSSVNIKFRERFPDPGTIHYYNSPHFFIPVPAAYSQKRSRTNVACICDIFNKSRIPSGTIGIRQFIELVKKEEDKYKNDTAHPPTDTKVMITRLRKIFYGLESWDDYLIKDDDVKKIKSPYGDPVLVKVEYDDAKRINSSYGKDKDWHENNKYFSFSLGAIDLSIKRERKDVQDRNGNIPEILKNQSVVLENGMYIDMGHVFAGLDALNYHNSVGNWVFQAVTGVLGDQVKIEHNDEAVTWIGDLGSVMAELIICIRAENMRNEDDDLIYNEYASPEDHLGNIDPYVIKKKFNISSGKKVSEILTEYYLSPEKQSDRFMTFATNMTGKPLSSWDGHKFSNEQQWLDYYYDQVNDAAAYYLAANAYHASWNLIQYLMKGAASAGVGHNPDFKYIVERFLKSLKNCIIREQLVNKRRGQ